MKILVTGANGQLGNEIVKQNEAIGRNNTLILTDVHNLDITNEKEVWALIKNERPDAVINCAAYTNVDGCESNENMAYQINAIGARNLSISAFEVGASIIQVSTDYVFDGNTNQPRREFDHVNPMSVYGKSKELGERLVRETNPRHFIVRTAWLYGEGNNFVRTILKLAKEKDEVSIVNDQIGSPTSTKDLAACILDLTDTYNYGTYHATCEGYCSWYDFAKKIFSLKGINIKVNAITTEQLARPAHRPKYSVLDNFMLNIHGMNRFRTWDEAVEEYLKAN
ncbi:MAG: dTDP-4-dehydrorhamnose reductase [Clostridia bacterium]|nr:dTDP-4-dehydrorhamnose reductase [Clostridia bacterium]